MKRLALPFMLCLVSITTAKSQTTPGTWTVCSAPSSTEVASCASTENVDTPSHLIFRSRTMTMGACLEAMAKLGADFSGEVKCQEDEP